MKKTISIGIVFFMLSASMLGMITITETVSAVNGNFGGGNGTASNPYLIEDVYDLQNMSSNLSAHYALARDIDASITRTWNNGMGFKPIGNFSAPFRGEFDGRGHSITRLYIKRPNEDYVGLFGRVWRGGYVHNFNLKDVNITGGNYTGAAIGRAADTYPAPAAPSPKAHWKMDEPYWNGTPGEVKDSSGNGNNATAKNGANTVSFAKYGRAGNFNGINQYIDTGKTAAQLHIAGSNPRTIIFWVYTRSFNSGGVYFCGMPASSDLGFGFKTTTNNNSWIVQLGYDDIAFSYPSLNRWVQFAIEYHETSYYGGVVNVYANGKLVISEGKDIGTSSNPYYNFVIGETYVDLRETLHFDGLIDDMYIYDRALSAQEIKNMYPAPGTIENVKVTGNVNGENEVGGVMGNYTAPSLMWAHWKMDEPYWNSSPGEVKDSSGNGNDGTAKNGANTTSFAKYGRAGNFNGINQYIDTGKTAAQLHIAGSNPRTVMFWVYTRSFNNGGVYECGDYKTNKDFSFRTLDTNNTWRVQLFGNDIDFTYPSLNRWVHFSIVYNGTNIIVYANGNKVTEAPRWLNTVNTNTFKIGVWSGNYFNGVIDDMFVFARALNLSEIKGISSHTTHLSFISFSGNVRGHSKVGGIVGFLNTRLEYLNFTGTVTGNKYTGGIVGLLEGGTLYNSSVEGQINGANYTGGIIGTLRDSKISTGRTIEAKITANVSGKNYVGGVSGYITNSNVNSIKITANVIGKNYTGGVSGYMINSGARDIKIAANVSSENYTGGMTPYLINSAANDVQIKGNVSSKTYDGGMIMYMIRSTASNVKIHLDLSGSDYLGTMTHYMIESTATQIKIYTNVSGNDYIGGMVGYMMNSSSSEVTLHSDIRGHDYVGGMAGYMINSTVKDVESYTNVSGNNYTGGISGYLNNTLINGASVHISILGNTSVGGAVGAMSQNSVIQFVDAPGANVSGYEIVGGILGNGLPSGTLIYGSTFSGTVHGHKYVGGIAGISSIDISNSKFEGNATATYMDVGGIVGAMFADLTSCQAKGNITGNQENTGGIAGSSTGTTKYCSFIGTVIASGYNTGGIIGENLGGTVDSSWAKANVISPHRTGLLVGTTLNSGTIVNSHASGNVTGTDMIGGLVGNSENSTVKYSNAYANVSGSFSRIGGLIGFQLNGQTLNTHASGTVRGPIYIGGLVGEVKGGSVSSSYANVQVTGNNSTGGIIGYLLLGTANSLDCHGNVTGKYNTGGVVGLIEASTLQSNTIDSYTVQGLNATGGIGGKVVSSSIETSKSWAYIYGKNMVGGIVGAAINSSISSSVATGGSVWGTNYTGGIIGYSTNSNILRSYSGSVIYGKIWVGGLAGYAVDSSITDSYSMSEVNGDNIVGGLIGESNSTNVLRAYRTISVNSTGIMGALIGINNGNIYSTFVDNETLANVPYVGMGNTSGIIERSTRDLLNSATYTGGWDFNTVWWITNGMTRPFLFSEFSTEIYDDHELQLLRLSDVSFTLHKDIYISINKNWSMWGSVGSFLRIPAAYNVYGRGHYIYNLRMTGIEGAGRDGYYAFIGQEFGNIQNLHLVNASIYVPYFVWGVGGLVGYKGPGSIIDSSFEGSVTYSAQISGWGTVRTGGLIGFAYCGDSRSINIYNSMFRGTIKGLGYVGGLVGEYIAARYTSRDSTSHITNSYVIGDIHNYAQENLAPATGGFVGSYTPAGHGTLVIQNSYFAGTVEAYVGLVSPISSYDQNRPTVPAVVDTYYHTSSTFDIFLGYPLTEGEMLHASSFRNWDFTGPWRIQENHTYPYLVWEQNYPVYITSPTSLPKATQGKYYSVKFNCTDANPTDVKPLWTLKTNAKWLHISQNGTLYGIPGPYDVGPYWVNVTVSDLRGSIDWANMTLIVKKGNYGVTITTKDVTTATQNVFYSVTYHANTPNGYSLTWYLETNASWLTLTGSTISGTPGPYDVGIYWVNISVYDGHGGMDWHNFTLTVQNVNDPPTITTTDVTTATQGKMYSVEYNAKDPDGDSLTWSLQTNALWLTLDGSHLWGIPNNSDVGIYWVNISVSDGHGGLDWHYFILTVKNVNDPPTITTKDVDTATQGVLYSVTYHATDPDGDSLTWNLKTDAAWLSLTDSTLSGTPSNADVRTFWVNISVSDGHGGIDWHNFTLTVLNVNDPPSITTSDVTTATQGVLYLVEYRATDPDGDSLTWALQTNATWLSLTGSTLSGTPDNADVGIYWVNISVSDGHGGLTWHNFTLTVINVNDPPVIHTKDVDTATQGVLYSVTYNATDPDGNSLTWALKTNALWLSLTGSTLSGTPDNSEVGAYWVNISVSDGNGGIAWHNFTLTVLNVNDPPTITTSDITSAIQGVLYIVEYNATDPDGNSLTWALKTNASWITLAGSTIYGIPTNADVGIFWVNISVSDGHGGLAWHNFTLIVLNVNDPPTITTNDVDTAMQNMLYSVTYNAIDPDGDSLTWALKTNALWLSLTGSTISGTPTNADVGIYWVNISVSDGHGGIDWHNFTLTVLNVNDPPSITTSDVTTATQGVLYLVEYRATDPDGDSLTWALQTNATWLSLTGSTLSGTPDNADVGIYWVNISVSDGHGGLTWHNFTLTVKNVNDPPVIGNFEIINGTVNRTYILLIPATDPDGNSLTWAISGPNWLIINATTGILSGTPRNAGNFTVMVTVSDGHGGSTNISFIIHITSISQVNNQNNINSRLQNTIFSSIPAFLLGTIIGILVVLAVKKKYRAKSTIKTNDKKNLKH